MLLHHNAVCSNATQSPRLCRAQFQGFFFNFFSTTNMAPTSNSLKLWYFPHHGRGEAIRLLLTYSGLPWEDFKIDREQWPSLKEKTPFGQLPVLEVNGQKLAQQHAIERYVASLAGLAPADPWQAAKVDEVNSFAVEFLDLFRPTFTIQDVKERTKTRQELAAGPLKTKLAQLTGLLQAAGGEYFVGGKLSLADFAIYSVLSNLAGGFFDGVPTNFLDDFPLIKAHHNRVASLPKIAEYYKDADGIRAAFKPLP